MTVAKFDDLLFKCFANTLIFIGILKKKLKLFWELSGF